MQNIQPENYEDDSLIRKTGNKFVYLIKVGNFYKIGTAFYIQDRLKQLQTGIPRKIRVVLAARFECYDLFERQLHLMFDSSRLRGEWFDLSKQDISKIEGIMEYVHFCEYKNYYERHNRIFPYDMSYIKGDIWRNVMVEDLGKKRI